jgi:Uma2 family endonuclease
MEPHEVIQKTIVPKQFIHEELNGKILYRKGYQDVLNKTKTLEEIMGSSSLQSIIISLMLSYIYRNIEDEGYVIATNEAGLHLSHGNNLAADIALYPIETTESYQLDKHYFSIAPKLVIEVDVAIEWENRSDVEYVSEKTQALFDFGVERVFWIFTHNRKILIATPNQDWVLRDWTKDIELLPGHIFNLQQLINKRKGIKF